MGYCTQRNFLLGVCVTQMIITVWQQIFDFLGYMWGPILANFFQIIFVIFGFFGACQYRPKYTIAYSVWCVFWCGWNIFVICFYLNVGILNRDSDVLNLGTGSVSWWESNGPGCKPVFLANLTTIEQAPWRPLRPSYVTDCLIEYHHLEVLQASFHVVLSVLGVIAGISISRSFLEEDDSLPVSKKNKKLGGPPPLYSIEYSPRRPEDIEDFSSHEALEDPESRLSSPRPMTPRRVKRRSVNSRGTTPSSAHRSNIILPQYYHHNNINPPSHHTHHHTHRQSHARSSLRSSQRRHRVPHQNPVTRLIEQQQKSLHQLFGDAVAADLSWPARQGRGVEYLSDSTVLGSRERSPVLSCRCSHSHRTKASYLNNSMDSGRLTGHCNPLYQQSSTHSLDQDCERPPSARSTYSNYHGTRAFSYTGGSTGQTPHHSQSVFLSHGPPAYNMHSQLDSETVI